MARHLHRLAVSTSRFNLRLVCAALVLSSVLQGPLLAQSRSRHVACAAGEVAASSAPRKPFGIEQRAGITWLIRPAGERFFSFGVSCVGMGEARAQFNPQNPGYAAWQHYPDGSRWAEATLNRLHSWGFTTIGGWSDFETFKRCADPEIGFAPVLHIGSTAGAPWWDMWDPKVTARMEQVARDQILPLRDDPRVIGYYSDNELGWWNATLFKMTLEQSPSSGQRQRLIALLERTYKKDWQRLRDDFETEGASNWVELERAGMLYLRPGGNGIQTMRRFLGMMAERYYSLIHAIIRKYDQRALILGDRYQSFFYPEVARAGAPYVDAISTNLNASWNDGTYPRFYLETLHRVTGKPILVSEFYLAATENRSGNQNDHSLFPVVATQAERARAFRTTLGSLLNTPYVVGADWFQYFDEPTHGRGDGENYNFGLVDIYDRPYEVLTQAISGMDLVTLKSKASTRRLDASQGVPTAPGDPLGDFKPTLALKHWDRERGFVKSSAEFPMADLYLAWNEHAVYVGLYAQDVVEDAYYRNKSVPAAERAHWTVSAGPDTVVHARIGAGLVPAVDHPAVRIVNISGLIWDVRNIAAMELPARLFGKERLRAGDKIEISSTFLAHGRAYRNDWKGSFRLGP